MAAPGCFCPDDCGCRKPWRPNYCGCRAHDGQTHVRAETGSRVTVRRDSSGLTISGTSRGLAQEWERDERGLPLGYYVTVRDAGRTGWLLGPYRTHVEALGHVDRGRELALKADSFAHFFAFGTARAPERSTVFGT